MSYDGDSRPKERRRRYWTRDEKRRIVVESLEDGASAADVARRHDLNANLLFTWRRQLRMESDEPRAITPILPVTIESEAMAPDVSLSGTTGQMEIVLAEGDRILVWADVETAALSRVLKALSRR
jgi:transposase